jgi:hypothetical protein
MRDLFWWRLGRFVGFMVALASLGFAARIKDSMGVEVSGVAGMLLALLATGVVAWNRNRW